MLEAQTFFRHFRIIFVCWRAAMKTIRAELLGKVVILLNGARAERKTGKAVDVQAPEKLLEAARKNPDAVAFGFVSGCWVAAA
jgi:hypothetical protein